MQAVVQLNAPPNTPVFTLQARDPDTDHNIHYFIVRDRTGGRWGPIHSYYVFLFFYLFLFNSCLLLRFEML